MTLSAEAIVYPALIAGQSPMPGKLLIDNDHLLYLAGLRDSTDFSFVVSGATVTGNIVSALGGSAVTGGGPVTLAYLTLGGDSVGGDTTTPTTVKSVDGFDLTVTVGATTALSLSAGRLVRILHAPEVWQVRLAASGAAASDVVVHLEPFIWPGKNRPTKVKATEGEIVEIEDGTYRGVLDKAFTVTDGEEYWAEIAVAAAGGLDAEFNFPLIAEYRLP